jgi:hypothetical protein
MKAAARAGRLATAGFLAALLAGCIVPPAREAVTSVDGLRDGETLVVGRVELVPPLRKEEQKMKALNAGSYANKMFILADERDRELQDEPKLGDFAGRIEAPLGENFFVRSPAKPFFILGGLVFLTDTNKAYFPGGAKVNIAPGDKAVYIGTIRYHRDEFFNITKVSVVDDYARASAQFKAKFGARYSLRKALLAPAKANSAAR